MRIPTVTIMALALLGWTAPCWGAGKACGQDIRPNGLDYSRPCFLSSPIPDDDQSVFFQPGSPMLSSQAKAILDRQIWAILPYPGLRLEIVGYADSVEVKSERDRIKLGEQRAGAVRDHLVARGVAAERIRTR